MKAYKHQLDGVEALTKWDDPEKGRIHGGCFALFDEMGVGKTKQVIDAAQILYEKGQINKVVVVAPVAVRSVWFDPELGELQKHLYTNSRVIEYHNRIRAWDLNRKGKLNMVSFLNGNGALYWMITNYDYIRQGHRLKPLMDSCDAKTLLILDESSAVKNWKALQTRACMMLRERCGRVVLLNGTPIANSLGDLYSQGQLLNSGILECDTFYQFRARYANMKSRRVRINRMDPFSAKNSRRFQTVVGWRSVEDLQRRFAPYVLRRLKKDCLDLPKKLPPVLITVELTKKNWAMYKDMRDEFIAWLEGEPSMASQAIVRVMRLAQLTSGFLGGLADPNNCQEVSREKLDSFLKWLDERVEENPTAKLLVWCRFRAELQRMYETLEKRDLYLGKIAGGQTVKQREYAMSLLAPESTPNDKPVVVLGNPKSGGVGLNLAASHNVAYCSNDYSLMARLQSMDRVHRPGQIHPVSYFDLMAVGPDGQRTVDHTILGALGRKQDLAHFTTKAWIKELARE